MLVSSNGGFIIIQIVLKKRDGFQKLVTISRELFHSGVYKHAEMPKLRPYSALFNKPITTTMYTTTFIRREIPTIWEEE